MAKFDTSPEEKFVFGFAKVMIVVIFLTIIGLWICMAYSIYSGINLISENGGIKPVLETLWCGKPGCMNDGATN